MRRTSGTGVILVNLGTPSAPAKAAVARFLRQFLSDPRVVEAPKWFWRPLLNLVIIPLRAGRVAAAYRSIWTDRGSPLRALTEKQAEALAAELSRRQPEADISVTFAMTYGERSLATIIAGLRRRNVGKIVVLPLYPQFSATTTGPVYDQLAALVRGLRDIPEIFVINHYFDNPAYIEALASSVMAHRQEQGVAQKLLMSFHGLPEAYEKKGDPYPSQCRRTATALAARLQLQPEQWACAFQSRFGREPWVKPYADELLKEWAGDGIESVEVICPAFATDCLETLEEMGIRNRDLFYRYGGKRFSLIPALNASGGHIQMMAEVLGKYL